LYVWVDGRGTRQVCSRIERGGNRTKAESRQAADSKQQDVKRGRQGRYQRMKSRD
jgi:hypothetical protein